MFQIPSREQQQHFQQQGYVVIPGLIDQTLIQAARDAFEQILNRAVDGEFGDGFRWVDEAARIPQLADDLLTPGRYTPAFGNVLEHLLPVIEGLLQKPVRCSWLLLLTGGAGNEYSVPLHRDDNMVGGDNETELLQRFRMNQSYFQAPLLPDDRFLQVVPGSHLRAATREELAAATSDRGSQHVADLVTIELQPGDVVFRHTDLLHQGWNPDGRPRQTLVSAMWAADVSMLDSERKYLAALSDSQHTRQFPPRLQTAVQRYLDAAGA